MGEPSHWQILLFTMFLNGVFIIVTGVMGFLIRRSITQIDERLKSGDEKFKSVSAEIEKIKETRGLDREYFAKEYVGKGDFIREIQCLDYKIDGIAADVKDLLKQSGRRPE